MILYRDKLQADQCAVIPARYGRMMVLSNDRYMGQAFLQYGEYSESEVELWRQLIPTKCVVADVGANIGAHTIALARLATEGIVVAFEPIRSIYHILAGNVALNGLSNVECHHAAVGKTSGSITVPAFDLTADNNFGGIPLGHFEQGNPVPLVTLDDTMPVVHFLKIDVEGMEQQVLEGATRLIRDCRPALYVENNPGPDQQGLIDYIHSLDYDLWWHYAPHFNPDNFAQNPDADDHTKSVVSYNMLCLPSEGEHEIGGLTPIPRA